VALGGAGWESSAAAGGELGGSMEVPENALEALEESAAVSEAGWGAVVDTALAALSLDGASAESMLAGNTAVEGTDPAALKATYNAVVTVFTEAARTDADVESITALLEDCRIDAPRAEYFTQSYTKHKNGLQANLRKTSFAVPHIVDVNWRLDYFMKSSQLEKVNEPRFALQFATQDNHGASDNIQIECSISQMQDLVAKLKEAKKRMEIIASPS